jgi:hypothetical protein
VQEAAAWHGKGACSDVVCLALTAGRTVYTSAAAKREARYLAPDCRVFCCVDIAQFVQLFAVRYAYRGRVGSNLPLVSAWRVGRSVYRRKAGSMHGGGGGGHGPWVALTTTQRGDEAMVAIVVLFFL